MKMASILLLMFVIFSCDQTNQNFIEGCAVGGLTKEKFDCGYLEVPENRNDPDSRTLKLAYVVVKARNGNPKADPIVYLQGGPGGATLPMVEYFDNHPMSYDRDFVFMDQRGTGFSEASCTDLSQKIIELIAKDLKPEEEFNVLWGDVSDCKKEMAVKGVDMAGYNSRENAADFDDLRKELGYEQWNLFGGSYGSRLALTYMRDFPDYVRSSVMLGMFPPHVNMYSKFISNFVRSLEHVFVACANDEDCNQSYPDLRNEYFNLLNSLVDSPFSFKYQGKSFTLNVQDMLLLTHQMLYEKESIALVPAYVMAIKSRNEEALINAVNLMAARAQFINMAMNWMVQAYEELPFAGPEDFVADVANYPDYNFGMAFFQSDNHILERWHSFRAAAIENEPVKSNIPSFVANGFYDPVTPPSYAEKAVEHLPNSFYVEFPNDGHSTYSDCYFGMVKAFLDDPSKNPDNGCAESTSPIEWK